jgi:hypothetical protein
LSHTRRGRRDTETKSVRCESEPGLARAPALVGSTMGESIIVLHTVVYGVLVVGGVCLVSLIGFELVQRLVPAQSRQRHNDVAGFIYAALGVI